MGRSFIAYAFVVDEEERLVGVVAMREMLLGKKETALEEIMVRDPFALRPDMTLSDAMKATVIRHFPVYPVVDESRRLTGLVRGQMLFEAQAIELSAQPGSMVGVEKEERLIPRLARPPTPACSPLVQPPLVPCAATAVPSAASEVLRLRAGHFGSPMIHPPLVPSSSSTIPALRCQ